MSFGFLRTNPFAAKTQSTHRLELYYNQIKVDPYLNVPLLSRKKNDEEDGEA